MPLKINEVEALVGVSRRNIRFYEAEGLLVPARNSQNGYREYGAAEVETLKRIKLLRKLGVPLEEIRRMQMGAGTVGDGMRRHMVTLEREQENLAQSMELCRRMKDQEIRLADLDAESWLKEMEDLEQTGTTFQNKQNLDVKIRRYGPSAAVAMVMAVLMLAIIALMIWAYVAAPAEAPPLALMIVLIAIPLVVIIGVVLAMLQRWKEIGGGEMDEARKY